MTRHSLDTLELERCRKSINQINRTVLQVCRFSPTGGAAPFRGFKTALSLGGVFLGKGCFFSRRSFVRGCLAAPSLECSKCSLSSQLSQFGWLICKKKYLLLTIIDSIAIAIAINNAMHWYVEPVTN